MNTWLNVGANGGNLSGSWPYFWTGSPAGATRGTNNAVTAWTGLIKVDNVVFTWMGSPGGTNVQQESFEYTSTRSTFIMNMDGKVCMNVTFLSPINPSDYKRQSIIGTYLEVTVSSIDGAEHSVQLYADISAEWVNPMNNKTSVKWSYEMENGVASHKVYQQNQSESNADYADDGAHWGYWYWSTIASESMSYQSGTDDVVRGNFRNYGSLPNTEDYVFRAINSNWPVFAFANNLGSVGKTSITTLYTIVHAQQNGVYFNGRDKSAGVPSFWTSYFESEIKMVDFFIKDRSTETGSLDHKISTDSIAVGGTDYQIITTLSARQAFASMVLLGTPENPYLFLKEISSDGNCQTVDVIFPAIPIFLYLNPELVKLLLEPLYEHQEAGKYPNTYAIHDLGAHYPQFIGHPKGDDEGMPLEECGNMIIMTLSYAQRMNDTKYLMDHYPILKQWVGYLIDEALIPADQLSTDDFQGTLANQTNLALKGIIAIEAMSAISDLTGHENDRQNFTNIAHDYISKWEELAVVNSDIPHTNLAYGNDSSYGLLYNLYGDRLLGLNLVPQRVYDMQSKFYPTIAQTYGIQLDTRNLATKSDWQMWVAAISSFSTQRMFISKLANWVNNTVTNTAFTDMYNVNTGDYWLGPFIARPVVGGHFALLALDSVPTAANYVKSH